jgi:hypothetical protein
LYHIVSHIVDASRYGTSVPSEVLTVRTRSVQEIDEEQREKAEQLRILREVCVLLLLLLLPAAPCCSLLLPAAAAAPCCCCCCCCCSLVVVVLVVVLLLVVLLLVVLLLVVLLLLLLLLPLLLLVLLLVVLLLLLLLPLLLLVLLMVLLLLLLLLRGLGRSNKMWCSNISPHYSKTSSLVSHFSLSSQRRRRRRQWKSDRSVLKQTSTAACSANYLYLLIGAQEVTVEKKKAQGIGAERKMLQKLQR